MSCMSSINLYTVCMFTMTAIFDNVGFTHTSNSYIGTCPISFALVRLEIVTSERL